MARPLIDWPLAEKDVFQEVNLGNTGFPVLVFKSDPPANVLRLDFTESIKWLTELQAKIAMINQESDMSWKGQTVSRLEYMIKAYGAAPLGNIYTPDKQFGAKVWMAQSRAHGLHTVIAQVGTALSWFSAPYAENEGGDGRYATLSSATERVKWALA